MRVPLRQPLAGSAAALLVGSLVVRAGCGGGGGSDRGSRWQPPMDAAARSPSSRRRCDFDGSATGRRRRASAACGRRVGDGDPRASGPLTVYWNKSPAHGVDEFPVGTIILKESQQADAEQRVVFAMVKRQARAATATTPAAPTAGSGGPSRTWATAHRPALARPCCRRSASPTRPAGGDCNGCHDRGRRQRLRVGHGPAALQFLTRPAQRDAVECDASIRHSGRDWHPAQIDRSGQACLGA